MNTQAETNLMAKWLAVCNVTLVMILNYESCKRNNVAFSHMHMQVSGPLQNEGYTLLKILKAA